LAYLANTGAARWIVKRPGIALTGKDDAMNAASAVHSPVRFVLLILFAIATAGLPSHPSRAGQPLYPDLRTAPPTGLRLEQRRFSSGSTHYLLRFDNLIGNWGGRLDIVANFASSRDLYQNVYDSYTGGDLVIHKSFSSDLMYHQTHNQFTKFASYQLLKKTQKASTG